jgi:hypothetical protein
MGAAIERASGNPFRVASILNAATDNVVVDDALSNRDLVGLARPLAAVAGGSMETFTFPASGRIIKGSSVLVPDMSAAAPILARFGSVRSPSGTRTSRAGRAGVAQARSLAVPAEAVPAQTPTPVSPTVGVVGDRSKSCG